MDKYAPTATHPAEARAPILPPAMRAVIDAGRQLERAVERAIPVRVTTLFALDGIDAQPGITATPLAAQLGIERQTLSGVLARMNADGLIKRRRDDKNPNVQHLTLTPAGSRMLASCRAKLAETVEGFNA